ncbi:MAG TPA: hypothetical protein VK932_00060 [Kofleriaceae bacterium]|nr:hypothetical protein [Kofleriaceae bacterium]
MTCGDRGRWCAALIACGVLLGGAAAAHAQAAEAEVLFRDGRKLIKAGKLAEGCDKIAASERLESSVGALLNLGDCREKLGELASAWAAFRKAEARAKHAGNDEKRRAEARRRAALIEPKLVYLVLQVERPPEGLVVRRGGAPVDAELWNTAVPVDPGTYEIAAAAPGHRPWRTTVAVDARLRRRVVTVPALEPAPPLPPPPSIADAPSPGSSMGGEGVEPGPRRGGRWTTARKISAGLAAAGAATLGTGAYFGWRANTLADESDQRCPLVMCGDLEGLRLNHDAREAAARANVLYAAGGAVAATAALLWIAGKPRDVAIRPGVAGNVGISLSGRF